MWPKKVKYMQSELSILTVLPWGVDIRGKPCRKLSRKYDTNNDNITVVKETIKQSIQLKAQILRRLYK